MRTIVDVWARTWKGYNVGAVKSAFVMLMPGYRNYELSITHDGEGNFRAYGEVALNTSLIGVRISSVSMSWNKDYSAAGGVSFKDEAASYITAADVNTAPTWNAIPIQTVRKNTTANVNLNGYAWDEEFQHHPVMQPLQRLVFPGDFNSTWNGNWYGVNYRYSK